MKSFALGAIKEERINNKAVFLGCEGDNVTVGGDSMFVSNGLYLEGEPTPKRMDPIVHLIHPPAKAHLLGISNFTSGAWKLLYRHLFPSKYLESSMIYYQGSDEEIMGHIFTVIRTSWPNFSITCLAAGGDINVTSWMISSLREETQRVKIQSLFRSNLFSCSLDACGS